MNQDFKDLLSEFNAHGVEYLIVGAHALAAHGYVRATRDLDVWIRPDAANSRRTLAALAAFGAPAGQVTEADLAAPGLIYQIGVAPLRIDVLTAIEGVTFAEAWNARMQTKFAGEPTAVLSIDHLIQNKRAAGRPQDLADVNRLEQMRRP